MWTLGTERFKWPAQSHTAGKWLSWEANLENLALEPVFLTARLWCIVFHVFWFCFCKPHTTTATCPISDLSISFTSTLNQINIRSVNSTHVTFPNLPVHAHLLLNPTPDSIILLISWHCWLVDPSSLLFQVLFFCFVSSRPLSNAGETSDWSHYLWSGSSKSQSQIVSKRANFLHCPQAPRPTPWGHLTDPYGHFPNREIQHQASESHLPRGLFVPHSLRSRLSAWLLHLCSQQEFILSVMLRNRSFIFEFSFPLYLMMC